MALELLRRRKYVVGIAVVIVAWSAALLVRSSLFERSRPPAALDLPDTDQVAEMRARLPHRDFEDGPPVDEFAVPPDHIPKILFWLSPGDHYRDSHHFARAARKGIHFEIAEIVIRTKGGEVLRLRCHDWGCNPVAFTTNGEDYFLGHRGDEHGNQLPAGVDGGVMLFLALRRAEEASRWQGWGWFGR